MKTFYKVLNIISNVVTYGIVMCVLFVLCVLYVPSFFGTNSYIVLSGSMEPVIHTGSLVFISEMDETPNVGDIVAYDIGDDIPVVHRIIEHNDNGYITKGDANDAADMNVVKDSQIIGKYVLTVPNAGYTLAKIYSHIFHLGPLSMPAIIPILTGLVVLINLFQYIVGFFIGLWISDESDN